MSKKYIVDALGLTEIGIGGSAMYAIGEYFATDIPVSDKVYDEAEITKQHYHESFGWIDDEHWDFDRECGMGVPYKSRFAFRQFTNLKEPREDKQPDLISRSAVIEAIENMRHGNPGRVWKEDVIEAIKAIK